MTETKTMENPSNSVDVSELKEDEPTETAAKQTSPEFGRSNAPDVSGTEMQYQENETGVCRGIGEANVDYNHGSAGSLALIHNDDFTEMPDLSHVPHNGFKNHKQVADTKSDAIQSGSGLAIAECRSNLDTTEQLEGPLNCAIFEPFCNDMSGRLTSDAEESMGKRPLSGPTTSSDGPPSPNWFAGGDLEGESAGIDLSTDYVECCGTHLVNSVVSFSRSSIVARGKTVYRKEGTFHIDVNDIVKIESQWSARYETGTLNIHFVLKYAAEDNVVPNATGLQELKFPVDCYWHRRQGAIETLNARYKELWSALLDTGLENCSPMLEGEAIVPTGIYFPKFDKPFEDVIYPKGDPDAVSISKRDVDLLLPDTFVNDTIIDFYIKYLKTRQKENERTKFHFFNSFFFRKLADMDKDPSCAFDGKAAFQRVRKWTRKVNLLEKDFIFIPVNYNYHWSLIVICYLGEVASYEDVEDRKLSRVPCILHMDSFRGNHLGLKDLMQSYLWEEWKERQIGTCDDLYSKFRNLKFVPLELPQQPNLYDCGLFLLHYVERFLEEVPANFSIYKITPSSHFLQADWFPPGEASLKRTHIEKLINDILDSRSENCTPSDGSAAHSPPECPNTSDDYENGVDFLVNPGPSREGHENSLHQIGQGIEMTLLPSSSTRNDLCTTSGLILKDLFEQTAASESLNDTHWGSLESKSSSLLDFKSPVRPLEGKVEGNKCFVSTELSEPIFQHLDGVTPEERAFAYSCGDFDAELVRQPPQENINTSRATSGELLNAAEPQNCDGMTILTNDPIISFSPNRLPKSPEEANHSLPNHTTSHPHSLDHSSISAAFTSSDMSDVLACKAPTQMGPASSPVQPLTVPTSNPHESSHPGDDGLNHEPTPEPEEQHAAKKMCVRLPDGQDGVTSCSPKDLTL